ncbi:hypothetical protein [Salipiger mucosus]|uniref:Cytochrome C oxidase assembly protein n=1 Tax=Salipiger mucosus DSM 16094 TaxID=1123237 RepID=S9QBJ5_9RHOB|nr:hypothetical protein [Salipiger mucosus]EPX78786.1 hypothetical protein Salmuc_04368 [Salipiger mucosus DSM 16094]
MSIARLHDLHKRRMGRNLGVGLVLAAFIVIIFGLTIVKIGRGDFSTNPGAPGRAIEETSNEN